MNAASLARDALVAACAGSAGVHAALAPDHLRETPVLGAGFVAAATALVALVALLAGRPEADSAPLAAGVLLAVLVAGYAATRLVAVPGLEGREPVDAIGVATQIDEIAGIALAIVAARPARPPRSSRSLEGAPA